MKNFGISLVIFLIWTLLSLWVYSWVITVDAAATENDKTLEVTDLNPLTETNNNVDSEKGVTSYIDSISAIDNNKPTLNGLVAKSIDNELIFSFDEGFAFKKDSVGVLIPDSTVDYKYKLKTYLTEHPELELHILSIYSPMERLEDSNLGSQRGDLIIKDLKAIGINEDLLVVESIIDDLEFNEMDLYKNGISFQFKPLDEKRIEAIVKTVVYIPNDITFYPSFTDTGILQNEKLDKFAIRIKELMDSNPSIKLKIIGHTDNNENAKLNYKMGQNYAEEMLWYFKNKTGIKSNRMSAISRGETNPVRSNKTSIGRIANRRVEIQFYK